MVDLYITKNESNLACELQHLLVYVYSLFLNGHWWVGLRNAEGLVQREELCFKEDIFSGSKHKKKRQLGGVIQSKHKL